MNTHIDRNTVAPDEMIERWAIKLALGNHGGEWATHYTEDQKKVWRACALQFIGECMYELTPNSMRGVQANTSEKKPKTVMDVMTIRNGVLVRDENK